MGHISTVKLKHDKTLLIALALSCRTANKSRKQKSVKFIIIVFNIPNYLFQLVHLHI